MNVPQRYIFLALLSGVLLTLSFPKTGMCWVAWFALIPLMVAVRKLDLKKSFLIGFICGVAHYLSLLYWLSGTMQIYGNLPTSLSLSILILLAATMALFVAVFSAGMNQLSNNLIKYYISLPCLWVALEYMRSFLFTGFPWELLGYSQFENLKLIQISDIVGVYGISYLIILSNVTIYLTIVHFVQRNQKDKLISKKAWKSTLIITACTFLCVLVYGTFRIAQIDAVSKKAPQQKISIVQGNIDQAVKWKPAFQIITTNKYCELSLQALKEKPDLVVWPETATPFFYESNPQLSRIVDKAVVKMNTNFLIGSPSIKENSGSDKAQELYNSAYLIDGEAKVTGKYDKVHLVPYGEYVPLKKWMPFLGKIVSQVGDFQKGEQGLTLLWKDNYRLGIQICYEIIFPNLSRNMVKNQANLLINITNDAWFGESSAAYQHFSMAVFRAVENKRALVRSANTGISGYIDPKGKIIETTSLFKEEVRTRTLPLLDLSTIYTKIGDVFAWICIFMASVIFIKKQLNF